MSVNYLESKVRNDFDGPSTVGVTQEKVIDSMLDELANLTDRIMHARHRLLDTETRLAGSSEPLEKVKEPNGRPGHLGRIDNIKQCLEIEACALESLAERLEQLV